MRFFTAALNLAVAATFTSAMPVDSAVSDTPATTTSDWYQGGPNFSGTSAVVNASGTCGFMKVASGTVTAGGCQKLLTYSFGLHHNPEQACNYRMWKGTADCSGDDYTDIHIAADSDVTCINTGVVDGGKWYLASGIYSCE